MSLNSVRGTVTVTISHRVTGLRRLLPRWAHRRAAAAHSQSDVAFKLPVVGIPRLQAGPLVSFVSRRVESCPSQWPMSGGRPEAAAAGQAGPGSASGWQGSQWQSQGDGSLSPRRLRQLSFKDTHDWKQSRATGPSLQVVVPLQAL